MITRRTALQGLLALPMVAMGDIAPKSEAWGPRRGGYLLKKSVGGFTISNSAGEPFDPQPVHSEFVSRIFDSGIIDGKHVLLNGKGWPLPAGEKPFLHAYCNGEYLGLERMT